MLQTLGLRAAALCLVIPALTNTAFADVNVSTRGNPTADLEPTPSGIAPEELAQARPQERPGPDAPRTGFDMLTWKESLPVWGDLPAATSEVEYSTVWLDAQPEVSSQGDEEWECMTEALYFEARGESVEGMFAVAEVILNRAESPYWPDTVCGVVRQGTGEKWQCQFSYYCDGIDEVYSEPRAHQRVGKVARAMLDGADRPLTGGADHYHTKAVAPYWAEVFARTTTIGEHHFYRDRG